MKTFLLLILSLLVTSCNSKKIIINKKSKLFSQFPKEENIEWKNLFEFNGAPVNMNVIDYHLVIANRFFGQEYHLYNYSLEKNILSKPYLAEGRGPGEMFGIANMGVYDNYLWLNDFSGKKILLLNKQKAFSENSSTDYIEYPLSNRFFKTHLIAGLRCIVTGSEISKHKIQLIDITTGKILDQFGKIHKYPKDIPLHVISKVSLTESLLKPTKDKLVLAYTKTDVVEVFNLKNKKSISIQGPEKFNLDYSEVKNNFVVQEKTRVAFLRSTITNENIFLLYSGKKIDNEDAYKGKYIYVYDWSLNPVKKIILDKEVSQICISEDGKTIYSFNEETGYIVSATIN